MSSGYNKDRQLGVSGIAGMSAALATTATPTAGRLAAQDASEEVTIDSRPADIATARLSTTVTHHDIPFDRNQVDRIFSHDAKRGFAF